MLPDSSKTVHRVVFCIHSFSRSTLPSFFPSLENTLRHPNSITCLSKKPRVYSFVCILSLQKNTRVCSFVCISFLQKNPKVYSFVCISSPQKNPRWLLNSSPEKSILESIFSPFCFDSSPWKIHRCSILLVPKSNTASSNPFESIPCLSAIDF